MHVSQNSVRERKTYHQTIHRYIVLLEGFFVGWVNHHFFFFYLQDCHIVRMFLLLLLLCPKAEGEEAVGKTHNILPTHLPAPFS